MFNGMLVNMFDKLPCFRMSSSPQATQELVDEAKLRDAKCVTSPLYLRPFAAAAHLSPHRRIGLVVIVEIHLASNVKLEDANLSQVNDKTSFIATPAFVALKNTVNLRINEYVRKTCLELEIDTPGSARKGKQESRVVPLPVLQPEDVAPENNRKKKRKGKRRTDPALWDSHLGQEPHSRTGRRTKNSANAFTSERELRQDKRRVKARRLFGAEAAENDEDTDVGEDVEGPEEEEKEEEEVQAETEVEADVEEQRSEVVPTKKNLKIAAKVLDSVGEKGLKALGAAWLDVRKNADETLEQRITKILGTLRAQAAGPSDDLLQPD